MLLSECMYLFLRGLFPVCSCSSEFSLWSCLLLREGVKLCLQLLLLLGQVFLLC